VTSIANEMQHNSKTVVSHVVVDSSANRPAATSTGAGEVSTHCLSARPYPTWYENMTLSVKPEVRIATPSEEDRATTTGKINGKFGEVTLRGFRVMRADAQTCRHSITILCNPNGAK